MKTRIITAVLALIIFVPFLIAGGKYFLFASFVLTGLAIYEIIKITFGELNKSILILSAIAAFGIFFKKYMNETFFLTGFLVIAFLLLSEIVISSHKVKLVDIATVLFLTVYITIGFYSLYNLRLISFGTMFYLLLTIWVTDSGAYFGGMKFGKRKLSPNISPNKSIEGSIIGSLSSIIVAVGTFYLTDIFKNIFIAILVTIVISIVGQLGDLVESAYKREYGVKDSSNILPGHGGIFDRFDSVILSAPFLLLFFEITSIY